MTRTWKTATGALVLMALPVVPVYAAGAAGADSAAMPAEASQEAQRTAQAALEVVRKMQADPQLWSLAERAAGVFIVPDYARAGLVVGGRGGQGVVLARQEGGWSGPAFYNFGGVSLGAEAGVEAGEVAMLLMDERTLEEFATANNFTLSAEAGLTIVNYSARAQANADADVIVWSDTEGVFANASVAVTNVFWDEAENRAYHGGAVTARQLLDGTAPGAQAARVEELLARR
jgi:SH3 domain-containing YSC84-like protein 1